MDNPATTYFMLSTGRSGHHAVAQWICSRYPGRIKIVNDCKDGLTRGVLKGRPQRFGAGEYEFSNPGDLIGRCYTFECAAPTQVQLAYDLVDDPDVCTLIVVRDHYNWIASLMGNRVPVTRRRIEQWKALMRHVLGRKQVIKSFVGVSFNEWFADKSYRELLATALNLGPERYDQTAHVSKFGGGSSFDGMSKQGDARNMRVLDRWQRFKQDPRYLKIVREPELVQMTREYFGFEPI